jgi:hypothetical protein
MEDVINNIQKEYMPTYKNVPIDELGYFMSTEYNNGRIVERVNICHKRDVLTKTNPLRLR